MDIYNNNPRNIASDDVYKSFNDFIFSSDIKVLGKLLYRHDFFLKTKDLPGDIVEMGVFKGSGMATFSKFINIYSPNSNKKVVGFDIFEDNNCLNEYNENDRKQMTDIYSRVDINDRKLEVIDKKLNNVTNNKNHLLISGDCKDTLPKFIAENPGFRISMLYIDVDLEAPTYYALKYLWDRVLPGGIIVFDEYEYHSFSESCGVDKFLKENNIKYCVKSTNWMAPTAFIVKASTVA